MSKRKRLKAGCKKCRRECANEKIRALRQRVEELEQEKVGLLSAVGYSSKQAKAAEAASAVHLDEVKRAYAAAEAAEAKLAQVVELADHQIPFYAYGDNEAAVEMSHRLEQILVAAKEE